jgi:hypothetical protein
LKKFSNTRAEKSFRSDLRFWPSRKKSDKTGFMKNLYMIFSRSRRRRPNHNLLRGKHEVNIRPHFLYMERWGILFLDPF